MKHWTFLFTSPQAPWQSARVIAPDKANACALLAKVCRVGAPQLIAAMMGRPPLLLCDWSGYVDAEPGVVELVPRQAA